MNIGLIQSNGDLDQITFVPLSTNTTSGQHTVAAKSNIHHMTFLSEAPDYRFGTRTGLLLDPLSILQCGVPVLDTTGIIRYGELVPLGQLEFHQALRVARTLIPRTSKE